MIRRLFAVALLVVAASCGHKDTTQSTTTNTNANAVQTPAAPTAHNAAGFNTESEAQAHCKTDQVVWLNTTSHVYHEKGTHFYGTTKHGEYACRKEADAAGDRNSKS